MGEYEDREEQRLYELEIERDIAQAEDQRLAAHFAAIAGNGLTADPGAIVSTTADGLVRIGPPGCASGVYMSRALFDQLGAEETPAGSGIGHGLPALAAYLSQPAATRDEWLAANVDRLRKEEAERMERERGEQDDDDR